MSANYAGLVCNEFPECMEVPIENSFGMKSIFIPDLIGSLEYHISHRTMACFLFFYVIYLLYSSLKTKIYIKETFLIFSILLFQIAMGIMNIVFELPTNYTRCSFIYSYCINFNNFTFSISNSSRKKMDKEKIKSFYQLFKQGLSLNIVITEIPVFFINF